MSAVIKHKYTFYIDISRRGIPAPPLPVASRASTWRRSFCRSAERVPPPGLRGARTAASPPSDWPHTAFGSSLPRRGIEGGISVVLFVAPRNRPNLESRTCALTRHGAHNDRGRIISTQLRRWRLGDSPAHPGGQGSELGPSQSSPLAEASFPQASGTCEGPTPLRDPGQSVA